MVKGLEEQESRAVVGAAAKQRAQFRRGACIALRSFGRAKHLSLLLCSSYA